MGRECVRLFCLSGSVGNLKEGARYREIVDEYVDAEGSATQLRRVQFERQNGGYDFRQ